jgi:hypothetical protein
MAAGQMPLPVSITGGRSVGWLLHEILEWITNRQRVPRRQLAREVQAVPLSQTLNIQTSKGQHRGIKYLITTSNSTSVRRRSTRSHREEKETQSHPSNDTGTAE